MKQSLLIGCGNLGKNILNGFLKKKKKLHVLDSDKNALKKIKNFNKKIITVSDSIDKISSIQFEYIMICVKPTDAFDVLKKIGKNYKKRKKIISFVAGLKEKKIKSFFKEDIDVIRLMPNLLVEVKKSTTGIFSSSLKVAEKKKIENYFSFFGKLIWLKNEKELNFFTAFFGGGPAYVSFFLKVLREILVKKGFNKSESNEHIDQLIKGTIELIYEKKLNYENVIKRVASKKGTTEKALSYLNKNNGFLSLFQNAILKAEKRSEEISRDLS